MGRTHSKLPGVKVAAMEPAELSALYLNTAVKPLDDIRVRQAIAHAIDRKGWWQFKGTSVSRPSVSIVPSGYLGTDEQAPLYPYDPEKAKKLLAEAGYPNGVTDQDDPHDATWHAERHRGGAGAAQESQHQSRHRARRARHVPCQDPRGSVADRALSRRRAFLSPTSI